MIGMFPVLIGLALSAVFGVLVFGIVAMTRGGRSGGRLSNKLMRLRVIVQFAAVVLIALAVAFRDG